MSKPRWQDNVTKFIYMYVQGSYHEKVVNHTFVKGHMGAPDDKIVALDVTGMDLKNRHAAALRLAEEFKGYVCIVDLRSNIDGTQRDMNKTLNRFSSVALNSYWGKPDVITFVTPPSHGWYGRWYGRDKTIRHVLADPQMQTYMVKDEFIPTLLRMWMSEGLNPKKGQWLCPTKSIVCKW